MCLCTRQSWSSRHATGVSRSSGDAGRLSACHSCRRWRKLSNKLSILTWPWGRGWRSASTSPKHAFRWERCTQRCDLTAWCTRSIIIHSDYNIPVSLEQTAKVWQEHVLSSSLLRLIYSYSSFLKNRNVLSNAGRYGKNIISRSLKTYIRYTGLLTNTKQNNSIVFFF